MSRYILTVIRKNPLYRFFVGAMFLFGIGVVVGLIFLYPLRHVYYGITSGDFLLNVTSVTAEDTVTQDKELLVAFCREPRTRVTAVDNIRTFYLQEYDNKSVPVYERRLPDGIDYQYHRS